MSNQLKPASRPAGRGGRTRWRYDALAYTSVAVIGASAFHGWQYLNRPAPVLPPSLPGLPAGSAGVQVQGPGVQLMVPPGGKPLDPIQLERLKQEQALKGKTVMQVGDNYLIVPDAAVRGGGTR